MRAGKLNEKKRISANELNLNQLNVMENTLTEIEALGLQSQFDLANGHASHEMSCSQQHIINNLPAIWNKSAKIKSHDAELIYKNAFQKLANTPSLIHYNYFKICPTASNSIDIVSAWLAENKIKTALLEPTFDNLFLILKRRSVELISLPEESLHNRNYINELKNVDAIFLVNPNNPTGKIISQQLFEEIINWCVENKKIIIIDNSFRFFIPQLFDVYKILIESGVTFISIEDTGKVWPTQEIKASLLFCSKNIFPNINIIYDEIFLCHSNFSLGILTEFLHDAFEKGLYESVWKQVAERRQIFRNSLDKNILSINEDSMTSLLSVEWVKINNYFENDFQLANHFRKHNFILLPGRQFYWNQKKETCKTNFVRFALLKPKTEFLAAIKFFNLELQKLNSRDMLIISKVK